MYRNEWTRFLGVELSSDHHKGMLLYDWKLRHTISDCIDANFYAIHWIKREYVPMFLSCIAHWDFNFNLMPFWCSPIMYTLGLCRDTASKSKMGVFLNMVFSWALVAYLLQMKWDFTKRCFALRHFPQMQHACPNMFQITFCLLYLHCCTIVIHFVPAAGRKKWGIVYWGWGGGKLLVLCGRND